MSNPFANFKSLDQLIQLIYQSVYKFVVISTAPEGSDYWAVHVGVDGRWLHGKWTRENLHGIYNGLKSSDNSLKALADNLARVFKDGELCITGWSPEKGADIKLIFNPAGRKPMPMDLKEMSTEDAARYTTSIFLEIARNAKSRDYRLFPSDEDTSTTSGPSSAGTVTKKSIDAGIPAKAVETKQSKRRKSSEEPMQGLDAPTVVRAPKGASLANPRKKARKLQALEFADDD